MLILARKTSIGKWSSFAETKQEINLLPADILGSELRTSNNTLSVWKVENGSEEGQQDVSGVVLAILTGSKVSSIESIDLLLLNGEELSDSFVCEGNPSEGDTSIEYLKNAHYNICGLTYKGLGELSEIFINHVRKDRFIKLRKSQIKAIIKDAFDKDVVCIDNFCEGIRPKITKILEATN